MAEFRYGGEGEGLGEEAPKDGTPKIVSKTIRSVITRTSENAAAVSKALRHAGGRGPPICEGACDKRGNQRLKFPEHEFDELGKLEKL